MRYALRLLLAALLASSCAGALIDPKALVSGMYCRDGWPEDEPRDAGPR